MKGEGIRKMVTLCGCSALSARLQTSCESTSVNFAVKLHDNGTFCNIISNLESVCKYQSTAKLAVMFH